MSRLPTVREFMDRHVQTISPDDDIMEVELDLREPASAA